MSMFDLRFRTCGAALDAQAVDEAGQQAQANTNDNNYIRPVCGPERQHVGVPLRVHQPVNVH